MSELLAGRVQAGLRNASHWLTAFQCRLQREAGDVCVPGSLNIALDLVFDWFDTRHELT
jgi:hypothetical protein